MPKPRTPSAEERWQRNRLVPAEWPARGGDNKAEGSREGRQPCWGDGARLCAEGLAAGLLLGEVTQSSCAFHFCPCLLASRVTVEPLNGVVSGTATGRVTSVHPGSGAALDTSVLSRVEGGSQPAVGDAEHRQLPVAYRRPAGAGGHGQRVQGPQQGRGLPEVGLQWAPGLGLSGQAPLICSEAGQGCGGLKRASGVMPIGHTLGLEREGRRREPTSRGAGGKSRNRKGAGGPVRIYPAFITLRAVLDT